MKDERQRMKDLLVSSMRILLDDIEIGIGSIL